METMTLGEAYKILGLTFSKTLTVNEVSRAYRKRAMECHPDTVPEGDRAEAEREFGLLVRAKAAVDLLLSRAGRAGGVGVNPFGSVVSEGVTESKFVADLREAFKTVGCRCFKIHGSGMQESGWPDLQVYGLAWTGHLEAKTEGGVVSKIQREVIRDLRERGTWAWVIRAVGGEVRLEDADGAVVSVIGAAEWREKAARGRRLVEMLCGAM